MEELDKLIFERLGKNIDKVYELIGGMDDHDIKTNRKKIFKVYDLIFQAQLDYKKLKRKWEEQ